MDAAFQLGPESTYYISLVHPSGLFLFGHSSGSITAWNAKEIVVVLNGHTRPIKHIVSLGPTAFASADEKRICIWDLAAQPFSCTQVLVGETEDSWLTNLVQLSDGSLLAATAARTLFLWKKTERDVWELATRVSVDGRGWIQVMVALPGARVALASMDTNAEIWHPATQTRLQTLTGHPTNVFSFALLDDGRYATGGSDGTLRIWDAHTGGVLHVLEGSTRAVPLRLCVLPGGRLAASGEGLTVWDLAADPPRELFNGPSTRTTCVLPDGELVGGGEDGVVRVWHGGEAAIAAELKGGHRYPIIHVGLLGGDRLASFSSDGKVCVWRGAWTAKARAVARCRGLKEKLMERVWDPERAGAEWLILRDLEDY